MKFFIFLIMTLTCIKVLSQIPTVYQGEISEKVEISISENNLKFIENYAPAKPYKMVLKPGIIIWSFNGKEITYHGVKPAYRDQNGTLVFPVKKSKDGPLWVFMITPDNDKMWLELDVMDKVMRGYYLR